MAVTVEVKPEYIAAGKARDAETCPIALSMRGAGFKWASVCLGSIVCRDARERFYTIRTPREVEVFTALFDDLGTRYLAEPFTFELELP